MYNLHFVTIPSTHTKLPKKRDVRVLGVTCLFPKLPSNAIKKSIFCFAYSVSMLATNCFNAFWKAWCSSKELLNRL